MAPIGGGRELAGRYVAQDVIGEGPLGVVHRGFDALDGQAVAIKIIRAEWCDAALHERVALRHGTVRLGPAASIAEEAKRAASIAHRNLLRFVDAGVDANAPYVVSELLIGETARALASREGPLTKDRILGILRQALAGLGAIHERGDTHGDVKLDNIFVQSDGHATLCDYATGSFFARASRERMRFKTGRERMEEFTLGVRSGGPPDEMAPEHARGGAWNDATTDVYALGVVLFHLLTGRSPFEGGARPSRLIDAIFTKPPDAREIVPSADSFLSIVCAKALEKEQSARYRDAKDMLSAIAMA
jgi:serine/threonine-protein kinase